MTGRRPIALALLLAGCAAAGTGAPQPADQSAAARGYQECRALADVAVKTEADIDQDILASRSQDWRRAGLGRVQDEAMREQTRGRQRQLIDRCLRSKGIAPPR
jgi:hypothetical protein